MARGKALGKVLGGVMLLLLVVPGVARASEYVSVPDPAGNFAHCNLLLSGATNSSGWRDVSCQYGPTKGRVTAISMLYTTSGVSLGSCVGPTNGAKTDAGSGWVTDATINEGGLFRGYVHANSSCALAGAGTTSDVSMTVTIQTRSAEGALTTLTTVQAEIDSITWSTAAGPPPPAFPTNFYPGGESGTAFPTPCIEATPESSSTSPANVHLDGTCSGGKVGSTWSWSSDPATGVTFESSTSRQTDVTFDDDGTYAVTLTQTKNGSAASYTLTYVVGADAGGVEGDDETCGAFWHVVCYAELILIPDPDAISDSWAGLATTAEEGYPLGPPLWAVGALQDGINGFKQGVIYGEAHPDTDSDLCTGTTDTVTTPVGELPVPDFGVPFSGDCAEEDKPGFIVTAQTWSDRLFRVALLFGLVMFVRRQAGRLTGEAGSE